MRLKNFFSYDGLGFKSTHKKKQNTILEFIGPSGVGKSTLFAYCIENLNLFWNTKETILPTKECDIFHPFFWDLVGLKIKTLDSLIECKKNKFTLLDYFINELRLENEIQKLGNERNFILDEGICYSFSKELMSISDTDFIDLLKNRALIYLRPKNVKTVVNRIKQRTREGGHTVVHHKGKGAEYLEIVTKNTVSDLDLFIEKFKKFSNNILMLDAEDSIDLNREKVLNFEGVLRG